MVILLLSMFLQFKQWNIKSSNCVDHLGRNLSKKNSAGLVVSICFYITSSCNVTSTFSVDVEIPSFHLVTQETRLESQTVRGLKTYWIPTRTKQRNHFGGTAFSHCTQSLPKNWDVGMCKALCYVHVLNHPYPGWFPGTKASIQSQLDKA